MTKVRCKDLPDSDRGDFSCRRAAPTHLVDTYVIEGLYVVSVSSWYLVGNKAFDLCKSVITKIGDIIL